MQIRGFLVQFTELGLWQLKIDIMLSWIELIGNRTESGTCESNWNEWHYPAALLKRSCSVAFGADCRWCHMSVLSGLWSSKCTGPFCSWVWRGWELALKSVRSSSFAIHVTRDSKTAESSSCVTDRRMIRLMGVVSSTCWRCYIKISVWKKVGYNSRLWDEREWQMK